MPKQQRLLFAILIGAASCIGASGPAGAEVLDDRFYLAPMVTYSFSDEDSFDPDDEVGGQLAFGKTLSKYLAMELFVHHANDIDLQRRLGSEANLDTTSYGIGALLFPFRDTLPLYGIVGGGIGQHDFDQRSAGPRGLNSQESEFVDLGLGYQVPLTDGGLALRAEYRYRTAEVDAPQGGDYQFRDDIALVGLQMPLGAKPTAPEAPEPEPRPEPEPPRDSDNDGVIDEWDECPDTTAGSAVNSKGCPEEAAKVVPIVLKGVTFEFDSAQLTASAEKRLDVVVNSLTAAEHIDIRIAGHTDSIGSEAYNLDLSQARADSVKQYLADHGIDPGRLETKGYGESQPVAPNTHPDGSDNPVGRAQNRRVELHVTDQ